MADLVNAHSKAKSGLKVRKDIQLFKQQLLPVH